MKLKKKKNLVNFSCNHPCEFLLQSLLFFFFFFAPLVCWCVRRQISGAESVGYSEPAERLTFVRKSPQMLDNNTMKGLARTTTYFLDSLFPRELLWPWWGVPEYLVLTRMHWARKISVLACQVVVTVDHSGPSRLPCCTCDVCWALLFAPFFAVPLIDSRAVGYLRTQKLKPICREPRGKRFCFFFF